MTLKSNTEKVEAILSQIDDVEIRESLRNTFYLLNPLELAKQLHSLDLSNEVKSAMLALSVGKTPNYNGPDLEPLIEQAFQQLWSRLVNDMRATEQGI